jgi:dihydroorotate dehydrogenase (NAD+) catalytic subunit
MPKLEIDLAGVRLRNPLMNASGVLGNSASLLRRVATAGAGAVVTKSVTIEPKEGYDNPTYVKLRCGAINAMGLPNPGYEEMAEELSALRDLDVPIIASIAPADGREAEVMSKAMGNVAQAIELNLSCPHASKLGYEVGSDLTLAKRILERAKAGTSKPIFAKLPPVRDHCLSLAKELSSADGFVVANTMRAMAIDVSARKPVLSAKFGGLSGYPLHPVVVGLLFELYEVTDKPLVGVGGVESWDDAVELMLAGARAVQIGSALGGDLQLFHSIKTGMLEYVENNGLTVSELVGLAHRA